MHQLFHCLQLYTGSERVKVTSISVIFSTAYSDMLVAKGLVFFPGSIVGRMAASQYRKVDDQPSMTFRDLSWLVSSRWLSIQGDIEAMFLLAKTFIHCIQWKKCPVLCSGTLILLLLCVIHLIPLPFTSYSTTFYSSNIPHLVFLISFMPSPPNLWDVCFKR